MAAPIIKAKTALSPKSANSLWFFSSSTIGNSSSLAFANRSANFVPMNFRRSGLVIDDREREKKKRPKWSWENGEKL